MQGALGVVILVVVAVAAVVAVGTLVGRSRAYDEIGAGGLYREPRDRRAPAPAGPEADEEARQMLAARNERRARRGQPPLDVEAELARLRGATAAAADPALEAEVRALVVARNERRARRGHAPLDVEAEVARRLSEISG